MLTTRPRPQASQNEVHVALVPAACEHAMQPKLLWTDIDLRHAWLCHRLQANPLLSGGINLMTATDQIRIKSGF